MKEKSKQKWTPTVYASQRLNQRFGVSPENSQNYINQIMKEAKYMHASANNTLVYYYKKRDMMIVVNPDRGLIVTVHPATEKAENSKALTKITIDRIANAIQREFRLMKTQLTREVRRLTEQQAELSLRIAELTLNKARCKAPHTRKLIQSRIEEVTTHVNYLALEIDAKMSEIKQAETEVKAVMGE